MSPLFLFSRYLKSVAISANGFKIDPLAWKSTSMFNTTKCKKNFMKSETLRRINRIHNHVR
jgi:hypothetical protein